MHFRYTEIRQAHISSCVCSNKTITVKAIHQWKKTQLCQPFRVIIITNIELPLRRKTQRLKLLMTISYFCKDDE